MSDVSLCFTKTDKMKLHEPGRRLIRRVDQYSQQRTKLSVQNSAAKLVFKALKRDREQPLLQALQVLIVNCLLFFYDSSPACLSDLFAVYGANKAEG